MASSAWKLNGELEKGNVDCEQGTNALIKRDARSRAGYKPLLAIALLVLLLWRYGFSTCVRPREARQVLGVPQYVLDYAPLVYLDVQEAYFPSDIAAQVVNTAPYINLTRIGNPPSPLTLSNLDSLNKFGNNGTNVYLTTTVDITESPAPIWLNGVVPDSTGKTKDAISCATIINDRGNGHVDAFYMYFYAYNQGNTVFWNELGDHIGDWEHNMVRFINGTPQAIWYSQHSNGQAFKYKVVEKQGIRPISYAARGSHANYAITGTHDHTIPDLNLPQGFILDYTSKGMLWDPTLSSYFYNYHANSRSFESIDGSPTGAMAFKGQWGDEQYPASDPRQPPPFFGFKKFVSGPSGPWNKQLNRTNICPDNGILCILREQLGP